MLDQVADLRLPETSDTELFVSYSYTADDGPHREELRLNGENAEYHPYILKQVSAFLERIGQRLNVEPPVTVTKVLKAASIILLVATVNFAYIHGNSYGRRWARLTVVADIPMPTAPA